MTDPQTTPRPAEGSSAFPYATHLDILFPGLAHIDLDPLVDAVEDRPRQGFVVPRGVVHRTRAPERSVILMVETAAIVPTGD